MTKRQLEKRLRKAFENATPGRAISTPSQPLLSDRQDWEGAVKPVKKVRTPIQFRAIGALAATVALVMLVAGVLILPRDNTGPAASGPQTSTPQNQTSLPDGFASSTIPSANLLSAIYEHCDVPFVPTQVEQELKLWGDKAYYEVELEYYGQKYIYLVTEDCTMAYALPTHPLMEEILAAVNYPEDPSRLPHTLEDEWVLTDEGVFLAVAIANDVDGNCYMLTPELEIVETYPLASLRLILADIFGPYYEQIILNGTLEVDFNLTAGGFCFELELTGGDDSDVWLYDAVTGEQITATLNYHPKIQEYLRENDITLPNGHYDFDIWLNVYFPEQGTMTVVVYKHEDADYLFCFDGNTLKFHRVLFKTYTDLPIDTTGPAPTVGNTEGPPVTTEDTQPAEIYKNEARDIAFEHAGLTYLDIVDYSVTVDKADGPYGVTHYDIWILTYDDLYEYEIAAEGGRILKYEKESLETATLPGNRISSQQALQIALDYLRITAVDNLEITVDGDEYKIHYAISFEHAGYKYKFEVGLYKGEGILSWNEAPLELPTPPDGKFTEEQALQVALDHLGIKAETIEDLEITINPDAEVPYYDISFIFMDHEFEFEISLYGGRILRVKAPEVDGLS